MRTAAEPPRGVVLVIVLVVVAMLGLAAGTFCELMLSEREAAEMSARQVKARALAESGVEMTRSFLGWDEEYQSDAGGWYNNPAKFQGILLIDDTDAHERGRFSLVSPVMEEYQFSGIRFGLEDESSRLNLNMLTVADRYGEDAGREILMGLPGMTEDTADAILDWIDEDDETREFGAESDYYQALDPPYGCANAPLATIEDLLLVRGVTPGLLFGVDANWNGYAESSEPDPQWISEVDNSDGSMNRGWSAYLTLYSAEANVRADGSAKIDINSSDLEQLYSDVEEALGSLEAAFIVGYRQSGPYTGQLKGESSVGGTVDFEQAANTTAKSVLDLVGIKVQVRIAGENEPTVLEPVFPDDPIGMASYLPTMMENLTANPSTVIPGRINVNQAPRLVLEGIPGMSGEVVDQILGTRQPDPVEAGEGRRYETWLLSEGVVTLEEMKELMPFVTGGGSVFRSQVVGYFDRRGPAARIEVILDATSRPVRVLSWRDISHLGPGYPREILGVEAP